MVVSTSAAGGSYAKAGDSLSNPMYGMAAAQSGDYDSIGLMPLYMMCFVASFNPIAVTPSQATYEGIAPARDGGYMTVVRPPPASGAFNPLYAHADHGNEGNYGGSVSAKAVRAMFTVHYFLHSCLTKG